MDIKNLQFIKDKKGWVCTDDKGNKAVGMTREAALNQYKILYELNVINPIKINVDKLF